MSEPVRRLTALPQLPSTSTHKFPPRHHPSVSVSTISIRKLWPLYAEPVSLPPLTTACPIWVILRSIATPFAAMVLRTSSQSAFRVERDHRAPESVLAPSSANPVVDSARKAGTQIKQRVMNSSKRETRWLRQRLVTLMETSQSPCHAPCTRVHHRSAQIVLIAATARVSSTSARAGSPPTETWCWNTPNRKDSHRGRKRPVAMKGPTVYFPKPNVFSSAVGKVETAPIKK